MPQKRGLLNELLITNFWILYLKYD